MYTVAEIVDHQKGNLGLSMTSRYAGRETMEAKAACVRAVRLAAHDLARPPRLIRHSPDGLKLYVKGCASLRFMRAKVTCRLVLRCRALVNRVGAQAGSFVLTPRPALTLAPDRAGHANGQHRTTDRGDLQGGRIEPQSDPDRPDEP
jgi:hypothetical protein